MCSLFFRVWLYGASVFTAVRGKREIFAGMAGGFTKWRCAGVLQKKAGA
jgi:hypothetical protein